jgi:hypothetical protein
LSCPDSRITLGTLSTLDTQGSGVGWIGCVEVTALWTGWKPSRFRGEAVEDALLEAFSAKKRAEKNL